MLNEYCRRCGSLLVNGKCTECSGKPRTLVIHLANGNDKQIRGLSESQISLFINWYKGEPSQHADVYELPSIHAGMPEVVYLHRNSICFPSVREVI